MVETSGWGGRGGKESGSGGGGKESGSGGGGEESESGGGGEESVQKLHVIALS